MDLNIKSHTSEVQRFHIGGENASAHASDKGVPESLAISGTPLSLVHLCLSYTFVGCVCRCVWTSDSERIKQKNGDYPR